MRRGSQLDVFQMPITGGLGLCFCGSVRARTPGCWEAWRWLNNHLEHAGLSAVEVTRNAIQSHSREPPVGEQFSFASINSLLQADSKFLGSSLRKERLEI